MQISLQHIALNSLELSSAPTRKGIRTNICRQGIINVQQPNLITPFEIPLHSGFHRIVEVKSDHSQRRPVYILLFFEDYVPFCARNCGLWTAVFIVPVKNPDFVMWNKIDERR